MKLNNLDTWLRSRARTQPTTTIVLHSTDGASAGSSISWLRRIGLSYHYVIERDGAITKAVPISRVALHAGRSVGPNGPDVNRYSIGIAFANHQSRGDSLTVAQIQAAADLIQQLTRVDLGIRYLTRHLDISPSRKTDPSRLLLADYKTLAKVGNLRRWKP